MKAERLDLAFLGLHPDRARRLREQYGGPRGALREIAAGRADGISPDDLVPRDTQKETLRVSGARVVYRGDGEYPALLETVIDPPDVLFVTGTLPEGPTVAVVGTRRCTAYGRGLARSFGRAIASAGWTLVSGLARGIDGEAHRGTIDRGGVGVAVLGSGSDRIYPREHADLARALIDSGGALITEYPPGTAPHGWRFPPRNRIISGMAAAVIVVEAAVTGGALVTAGLAMEQGRDLFAVPGDVDREASVGCNLLIRDGAIPVMGPDDLIEAVSLVVGPPARAGSSPQDIPSTGVAIDELGEKLGLGGSELLTWLGEREIDGTIRIEGDLVFPA